MSGRLTIPAKPGRLVVFGAPDGRLSMAVFHDPWSAAEGAEALAKQGFEMLVFEGEEDRPDAGQICIKLFPQGSFGKPRCSAAECVEAMNQSQHTIRFCLG
jgi:hypothetical protein